MPTIQSATARLITKQLVTVRSRRVVMTDKIIKVLPSTVIMITVEKKANRHVCCHGKVAKVRAGNVVFVDALLAAVGNISETDQCSRDDVVMF